MSFNRYAACASLLVLLASVQLMAVSRAAEPVPLLKTEFAFVTHVTTGPAVVAEPTPQGATRYVPILGGTVAGPGLKATILAGADLQVIRADGVIDIEAHYMMKTDDDVIISVVNRGLRHGPPAVMARLLKGEIVPRDQYYFRTVSQLQAPLGSRYEHLNKALFIATAEREAGGAALYFYRLQ
jgi:Protein of unknown function (DUF3237)